MQYSKLIATLEKAYREICQAYEKRWEQRPQVFLHLSDKEWQDSEKRWNAIGCDIGLLHDIENAIHEARAGANNFYGKDYFITEYANKRFEKITAWLRTILADRPECHGFIHAIRVYRRAETIAMQDCLAMFEVVLKKIGIPKEIELEFNIKRERILITALGHDLWDYKFCDNPDEMKKQYRVALEECGFLVRDFNSIVEDIDNISYSKGNVPESLEGKIVQDADRLAAIGQEGIRRCEIYNELKGLSKKSIVQHAKDKLVKLKDLMNTEAARMMAEPGHQYILDYIAHHERTTE